MTFFFFAGYSLMHAAYSICDLDAEQLLIPMIITESQGKQSVKRFEAETQSQAVTDARAFLDSDNDKFDLWAFAREGLLNSMDVISVDCGGTKISHVISIVQPFRPNRGLGQFALLQGAFITVDGYQLDDDSSQALLTVVHEGVDYHPKQELWNQWSM